MLVLVLLAALGPEVIPLIGAAGMGHACPTPDKIYTAGHVAATKGTRHTYRTPFGISHTLWIDKTVDLATIAFPKDEGIGRFEIATAVQEGEKVHWFEYNFGSTKDFFAERRRKAKVLRVVADHIVFDKGPEGGASGSCLLNELNQVVGIVIWGMQVQGSSRRVGVAVSLVEE